MFNIALGLKEVDNSKTPKRDDFERNSLVKRASIVFRDRLDLNPSSVGF